MRRAGRWWRRHWRYGVTVVGWWVIAVVGSALFVPPNPDGVVAAAAVSLGGGVGSVLVGQGWDDRAARRRNVS